MRWIPLTGMGGYETVNDLIFVFLIRIMELEAITILANDRWVRLTPGEILAVGSFPLGSSDSMLTADGSSLADNDTIRDQSTRFDLAILSNRSFVSDDALVDRTTVSNSGVIPDVCSFNRDVSTNINIPAYDAIVNNGTVADT